MLRVGLWPFVVRLVFHLTMRLSDPICSGVRVVLLVDMWGFVVWSIAIYYFVERNMIKPYERNDISEIPQ